MGTSAYSDDLVLPERPVQSQPPNEVTSSQSPTLNAHIGPAQRAEMTQPIFSFTVDFQRLGL